MFSSLIGREWVSEGVREGGQKKNFKIFFLNLDYLWRSGQESIPEPPQSTSATSFLSLLLTPCLLCGLHGPCGPRGRGRFHRPCGPCGPRDPRGPGSLEPDPTLPLLTRKHAHVQSHREGGQLKHLRKELMLECLYVNKQDIYINVKFW